MFRDQSINEVSLPTAVFEVREPNLLGMLFLARALQPSLQLELLLVPAVSIRPGQENVGRDAAHFIRAIGTQAHAIGQADLRS